MRSTALDRTIIWFQNLIRRHTEKPLPFSILSHHVRITARTCFRQKKKACAVSASRIHSPAGCSNAGISAFKRLPSPTTKSSHLLSTHAQTAFPFGTLMQGDDRGDNHKAPRYSVLGRLQKHLFPQNARLAEADYNPPYYLCPTLP